MQHICIIETEDKEPKPAQQKYLIEHARANNIRAIFTQLPFFSRSAQ